MPGGRPSTSDLAHRLGALGFNLRSFAAYIGAGEATVRRWAAPPDGGAYTPMPRPIEMLLEMLEEKHILREAQAHDGVATAAHRVIASFFDDAASQGWTRRQTHLALLQAIDAVIEPPPELGPAPGPGSGLDI